MSISYQRGQVSILVERFREGRGRIQVLAGPRQAGKSTIAQQAADRLKGELHFHYASADEPGLKDSAWIAAQWEIAREISEGEGERAALVLDEVQKLPAWSETVKRLWDEDTRSGFGPRVTLLGLSPLMVGIGLTESLAGRFEVIRVPHWSYAEMRDAFGWDLDRFIYFGGYPGAATMIDDESRWRSYVLDSLIEPTIARDVLLVERVDKPALLRQLFVLGCQYAGQVLSYTKMLGQLADAGNTTTLAHYLELLGGAGMIVGLEKYSASQVARRRSSPKLCVLNNALISAQAESSFEGTRADRGRWGRLVENAVGAHLINAAASESTVGYWRDRGKEADYVVESKGELVAIEVKSGPRSRGGGGMEAFLGAHPGARPLLIGGDGIPLEEWFERRWS